MMLDKIYKLLLITSLVFLCGCSKNKSNETIIPVQKLYAEGYQLLDKGRYKEASEKFSQIYFQHPGSSYTANAQLLEAYSLFKLAKYSEASDILKNFIDLYPVHHKIPYALYLRAYCYYAQLHSPEHNLNKINKAKIYMQEMLSRFPKTEYAALAKVHLTMINDYLAANEMNIGRYYLKQKNPIAAIKRFNNVISGYGFTNHYPEALYRMVEGFLMLGLKSEALVYADKLARNYKDTKWNKYSFEIIKKF